MAKNSTFTIPPVKSHPAKSRTQIWRKRALWVLLVIIILPLLGILYQIIATQLDKRNYPPLGQMVDVGGYSLHLYCMGDNAEGKPTVILEQGLGGTSAHWARVQPDIAQTTRVCAYDRAGMGWSDPGPGPRDAEHIAAELHNLLHNAGVPGPYVLAGWSFGGLYVRNYVGQYPEEVVGLVLLDSSHPDQWTSTPAGQAQFARNSRIYTIGPKLARIGVMRVMGLVQPDSGLPSPQSGAIKAFFAATKDGDTQSAEFLTSPATNDQVRNLSALDDMPLFVLTATEHGTPPDQEQLWQGWQNELALLSTNSVHQVVTGADHASLWLDPETAKVSVAAILHVVEATQTGERVKP
ncbi:MAG TPA: alpha/beta hydrolase [Anaerolineales bacterium]